LGSTVEVVSNVFRGVERERRRAMSCHLLLNWFVSPSWSLLPAVGIQLGGHRVHSARAWVLFVDATKAPQILFFGVNHGKDMPARLHRGHILVVHSRLGRLVLIGIRHCEIPAVWLLFPAYSIWCELHSL
jgi:hypothetical protein